MNDIDQKLKLLANCRFLPGSWAKRFVGSMSVHHGDMSESQIYWINRMYYMYRRQIPAIARRLGMDTIPALVEPEPLPDKGDETSDLETLQQLTRWSERP